MAYINKIKKGNEAVDIQDIRIPDIVTGEGGDSGKALVVQNEGVQFVDILNNTQLTGTPQLESNPATSDSSTKIATTKFVQDQKLSPALSGTPTAPTAATATNTTQIATTAFVQAQKVSPVFTGTPKAPDIGSSPATSSQIATKTYVDTVVANKDVGVTGVKGSSESTYRTGQVNITKANLGLGNVENYSKAQILASATLTGTPTAPTPTESSGNTQIATKEYVDNFVPDLSSYMQKGVNYVTAGQTSGQTLGASATAEGYGVIASGEASHAEGWWTKAIENDAHAEGRYTTASGIGSHAEGVGYSDNTRSEASGEASHVEGHYTKAPGYAAHAEGDYTVASGNYSHAQGQRTTAQRASQHVFGEYNVLDTGGTDTTTRGSYIEIVGNGTSNSARSNARTLDWSGNETLAGKLTVGAAPTANMDVTTKQYVDTGLAGKANTSAIPAAGTSNPIIDGTASAGSANTWSRSDHVHPTDTSRAPLASPALTGTPTAPTATAGTNTTQIATTAFVQNALSGVGVTVDSALSDSSVNPVQNKVITSALNGKAASSHTHNLSTDVSGGVLPVANGGTGASSVDNTPTSGSSKMVTSGGVYTALSGKAASNHTHTTSIATSTGTSAITLAANSKYSISAGGTSYIFTTPPDTTYSSKAAASGGTDVSLVTTGEKYTWNNKSNLTIGTTSTTAAAGNHTHATSIATSTGTNQITLAANTKYAITAGETSYVFTTPPDNNTTYSAGTGLSLSGTTFNHSNSVSAQTTQAVYPIKIDAQGHISGYGSAVTSKAAASGGTDTSLVTTGEKYTWNNKANSSHNHSAGNITSGTLDVARGGTGNSSVDTTPTSGSTKMVTSGGLYTALNAKQAKFVTATGSLTVAGWSSNSQTITVSGVTTSNLIQVAPAPASASEYGNAGIICTTQAANSLTFTCKNVPTSALTVNVVIWN